MPDDAPRHLESLTVSKLKAVAKRHGVDVSPCKYKKDFIERLAAAGITEAQVADALASGEPGKTAAASESSQVAEARRDVEVIAGKTPSDKVLPAEVDEEVERNIDRALLVRPSFFEIDSQVQTAWNHMIMADYHDALKVNSDTRSRMLDRFSSFQVFSAALSIRAAESILSSLNEAAGKTDPLLRTALAEAKRAFIEGSPKHREETLERLESMTLKAYESFFEGSTRAEAELRTMLSDYESFGTQTLEPRRLLEIAEQARQAFNVAEYAKVLDDAKQAATRAKAARTVEIEKSFGIVRSAVREAHEVGAVLSVGEDDITAAKEAFDQQAFRKASELLASIERTADQAHIEKVRDKDIRDRQTAKVSATIASLERTLQEAASYGMDVEEGLLFVTKAKSALQNRDVVNAAKLARHVKDQSADLESGLDKERVDRGVASKVEDAKCGKCGKESLYSFPNDRRKCIECGHSFSMVVEPARPTMEPIEKPVSQSHVHEQNGGAASPQPAEQPKKKIFTRSLKKY